MGLKLFSINHRDHDLGAVERLNPLIDDELETRLHNEPNVYGALVLATCNRVEILVDTNDVSQTNRTVRQLIESCTAVGPSTPIKPTEYSENDVVEHLCALACGLKSMVVGEREITGQLRHALRRAHNRNTASGPICTAIDTALQTARIVERETGLSGIGRSIAAIGLDHAGEILGDYRNITVTLFGTGSYAGAAVTHLKDRGCQRIYVHSASGRAQTFAEGRGLTAISHQDLPRALSETNLIISCRGFGAQTVTADHVRQKMANRHNPGPLVVLDLAIVRDVDPRVAEIPGVTLIDLETVRTLVPDLEPARTARAHQIVEEAVDAYRNRQASRALDPVIIRMRNHMNDLVAEELARVPQRALNHADVEKALNRLANRILHRPTAAAHAAGARGEYDEYIDALALLTGQTIDNEKEETA